LAGGLNTAVTAAVLALLALVIDARLAYTIVFAGGVVLAAFLADRFVFGVDLSRGDLIAYALVYVGAYAVGLGAVEAMARAGWPGWMSGAVVVVTAPLTFLGGVIIARRRQARPIGTATASGDG
jgi:putative flippase GtrA